MTDEPPAHAIDWQGNDWTPDSDEPAAHPNARFTTPAAQCPSIADEWEDPKGVPIDAFLFGGRRADVVPLVREAFDWEHGVFMGATMSSRRRRRPPARSARCASTRWRCCRSAATTWPTTSRHWLKIGRREGAKLPRIFYVNWFRKDEDGKFLWPGLRRELARAGVGLPPLRRRGRDARDPDRLVPAPATSTRRPRLPDAELEELLTVDEDKLRRRSSRSRSTSAVRRRPPGRGPRAAEFEGAAGQAAIRAAAWPRRGTAVSLAEETEAGSSAGGPAAGADRREGRPGPRGRRPGVRAAYLRRLSAATLRGDLARAAARRGLGAVRVRVGARRRADRGARVQPDARGARLRAARLGGGDQHRRLAVPGRLGLGELESRAARGARLLHPIVGIEREGSGRIAASARPARGDAPRVGHALRPRPPAHRRRAGEGSRTRVRETLSSSAQGRARLRGDARARRRDDQARPRGRRPLPARRGRRGRRLPRVAAARQLRPPRRARVRLQRGGHPARPRLRARDPRRRGASTSRRPCRSTSCRPASAAARVDGDLLLVDKANAPSPVHRRERMDYIGVRRVDSERRDHRRVAPARALHDQGLRRAGVRDAAAGPQAAPVRSRA